jgi:hypothetical protein
MLANLSHAADVLTISTLFPQLYVLDTQFGLAALGALRFKQPTRQSAAVSGVFDHFHGPMALPL